MCIGKKWNRNEPAKQTSDTNIPAVMQACFWSSQINFHGFRNVVTFAFRAFVDDVVRKRSVQILPDQTLSTRCACAKASHLLNLPNPASFVIRHRLLHHLTSAAR